jgi:hypothetical protein
MTRKCCVVVENASAGRIVERILSDRVWVETTSVRSGAMMRATTILFREDWSPAVLLLDSDSLEARAIEEEQLEIGGYLRRGSGGHPNRLVLAIPQVEAVLFTDRSGLEQALGKEMTDEDAFEARFRPKAVLHRLLGNGNDLQQRAVEVIDRLDEVSLRRMAAHPVIREIQEFVEEVSSGKSRKPTNVRRAS